MFPAQRFGRETVSLLDVMWPRRNQRERPLLGKNFQLYNNGTYGSRGMLRRVSLCGIATSRGPNPYPQLYTIFGLTKEGLVDREIKNHVYNFIPRRDRRQRTLWTMLLWLRRRRFTWPRFPSTFHLLFININTYFLIWDMSIGISRSPFVLDLILKLSNNWAIVLWSKLPKNNRHGGAIGYVFSTLSVFLYDEQFKKMPWG